MIWVQGLVVDSLLSVLLGRRNVLKPLNCPLPFSQHTHTATLPLLLLPSSSKLAISSVSISYQLSAIYQLKLSCYQLPIVLLCAVSYCMSCELLYELLHELLTAYLRPSLSLILASEITLSSWG